MRVRSRYAKHDADSSGQLFEVRGRDLLICTDIIRVEEFVKFYLKSQSII